MQIFPALGAVSSLLVLSACTTSKPPPMIRYDAVARPAVLAATPPRPVEIVEVPKPLPLPGQLQPVPADLPPTPPEAKRPSVRVAQANAEARVEPAGSGYVNAIQVYPFADGALYQLYAAPGVISDIALEPGEKLAGAGPVAAGDTVRWIIGDTESGSGPLQRVHILVKPIKAALRTNLIINTDRRTYHLELRSDQRTYMAAVSWRYPQDQLIALRARSALAEAAEPAATVPQPALDDLKFRYRIEGDEVPWRPLRAFDDGTHVYIEFPDGIGQGEMPPLWVIGPKGTADLVNYRVRGRRMIVDQLFAAAELRLGEAHQQKVRIVRSDGRPAS
ncbi:P-type conjugative transfer protein TrbG [Phenylobacterium montanum]|uniref:P-type conjugative transfer protein TrbG n=1 Tax=Phenylobacterium montanum TaxID=2823693 RepID=A0A975G3Y9_9CAUL|nr:P-type conjugative transfer protein TrbG [Caulobacter sp. S6]QUD90142.1 P-type conjugative transfer protein TrbG [Caulobacter sp. S6]